MNLTSLIDPDGSDPYINRLTVVKSAKGIISILGIVISLSLLCIYSTKRFNHIFYRWVRVRIFITISIFLLGLLDWTMGDLYSKGSPSYHRVFISLYVVMIPLRILFFVMISHDIFLSLVIYFSISDPKHPLKDLSRIYHALVITLPGLLLFSPIYGITEIETIVFKNGTLYRVILPDKNKNSIFIYYLKALFIPEIILPLLVFTTLGLMILIEYRRIMRRKDASIKQFNGEDKFRKMNNRFTLMVLILFTSYDVFRTTDLIIQLIYRWIRVNNTNADLLESESKLILLNQVSFLIMLSYYLFSPIITSCIDTNFIRCICASTKEVRDTFFIENFRKVFSCVLNIGTIEFARYWRKAAFDDQSAEDQRNPCD